MHGNNVVRGFDDKADKLQVHEVFFTIQGEGLFSGERAIFVRLTGCNLRCFFCDTTWGDENDPWFSVGVVMEMIVQQAPPQSAPLIVLTGGEPVRQALAGALVQSLLALGYVVQVETAGTIWQDWLSLPGVKICVSPKSARVHPQFMVADNTFWKYVLKAGEIDPEDGLPLGNYQRHKDGTSRIGGRLARPPGDAIIYVTPMDEGDAATNAANYGAVADSALRFGYVAQLQVHKYLNLR